MKKCVKCKGKYPATTEYFYQRKDSKDGLRADCKKCRGKAVKKFYQTKKGKAFHKQANKKYRSTIKGYLNHVFGALKERCENPKDKGYKYYGGRGIKCLFKSSDEFIDYIINELQINPRGLQIDRVNNNGHYEKGNIRFVTAKENSNNRRNSNNRSKPLNQTGKNLNG